MFNWIKNFNKKIQGTRKSKSMLECINGGECPDCGVWEMYEGPSGGMSTNILCGNCGSEFNYTPGFSVERIHWVDFDKELVNSNHYCSFNRNIWGKYEHVAIKRKSDEPINWCKENSIDNWSVKNAKIDKRSWDRGFYFFFSDNEDAIRFKLIFG